LRSDDLSVLGRVRRFLAADWKDKAVIDSGRIGLFGFSKGGYTGLALVGTAPDGLAPIAPFT
jgi:predicted peptidase